MVSRGQKVVAPSLSDAINELFTLRDLARQLTCVQGAIGRAQ